MKQANMIFIKNWVLLDYLEQNSYRNRIALDGGLFTNCDE